MGVVAAQAMIRKKAENFPEVDERSFKLRRDLHDRAVEPVVLIQIVRLREQDRDRASVDDGSDGRSERRFERSQFPVNVVRSHCDQND